MSILETVGLSNIKGGIMDMLTYILWGLVILGVAIFGYLKWQDKKIYVYPVRILRQRNNGMVKEQNTFGGYVKKGNITQFLVKMSKFKKKPTDKLPDSSLMDEDNRVYYWQVSPDSPLIQVKREFTIERLFVENENFKEPTEEFREQKIKEIFEDLKTKEENINISDEDLKQKANELFEYQLNLERNKVIDITKPTYTPVPTDLKQQAINDINSYKTALNVDVNKQFAYFIMGVIALVIFGAIIFYIAVNKGDIPILTK